MFDSATTSHFCPLCDIFINYQPIDSTVKGVGNSPTKVIGFGSINLKFDVNGKTICHMLHNVLHIPNAANGLVSVTHYTTSGGRAEFLKDHCLLHDEKGQIVGKGVEKGKLYLLLARAQVPADCDQVMSTDHD
jgi:hypothetical protein